MKIPKKNILYKYKFQKFKKNIYFSLFFKKSSNKNNIIYIIPIQWKYIEIEIK